MFNWLFNKNKSSLRRDESDIKLINAFKAVKKEFEEHLEAINENTNEIQSNYELYLQLDSKLDKIESRLNEIELFLRQFKSSQVYFIDDKDIHSFVIQPLNNEEKDLFKTIYELDVQDSKITYQKLAEIRGLSQTIIRERITSLIEKGVPITKHYLNQVVMLNLDPKFKDLQAKKNIISM